MTRLRLWLLATGIILALPACVPPNRCIEEELYERRGTPDGRVWVPVTEHGEPVRCYSEPPLSSRD